MDLRHSSPRGLAAGDVAKDEREASYKPAGEPAPRAVVSADQQVDRVQQHDGEQHTGNGNQRGDVTFRPGSAARRLVVHSGCPSAWRWGVRPRRSPSHRFLPPARGGAGVDRPLGHRFACGPGRGLHRVPRVCQGFAVSSGRSPGAILRVKWVAARYSMGSSCSRGATTVTTDFAWMGPNTAIAHCRASASGRASGAPLALSVRVTANRHSDMLLSTRWTAEQSERTSPFRLMRA
ncbi:hypothetical protein Ae406Ps2_6169 [Pseudonocardia sp. Ae406_Ps2]|nr:hypothetical protein Ae406Ps2_6169 [Pseudonocardia sp. Ae406_Ps2]